jgi:hypothetical protein
MDDANGFDFGLLDFLMRRLTANSQDLLRLMVATLGPLKSNGINIKLILAGLDRAVEAFSKNYESILSNEFLQLKIQIEELYKEVKTIYVGFDLPEVTAYKLKKEFRKWEVLVLLGGEDEVNPSTLEFAGAYYALCLASYKVSQQVHDYIYQLLIGDGDFLSNTAERSLARLIQRAEKAFGGVITYEGAVCSHFHYRNTFADNKQTQAVRDWSTLSEPAFKHDAKELYDKANRLDSYAIAVILASILGLPLHWAVQTPILDNRLENWILGIDVAQGLIKLDINSVFKGRAKVNEITSEAYENSSSILVKPLPRFLHELLIELIKSNHNNPITIGELLNFDVGTNKQTNFNHSRFINSVAKFSIHTCRIDRFLACVLANDYRSITTSKFYYTRISRESVWNASNKLFKEVGWGVAAAFVEGFSAGSMVVPKDSIVEEVFQDLLCKLESLRPPNRASIKNLLVFHDSFCRYNASLAIFCLALRNSNPIPLQSADIRAESRYVLIDDKHSHEEASLQAVAMTNVLRSQLDCWYQHCVCMISRLTKLGYQDKKFMGLLQGVVDRNKTPLFFVSKPSYEVSVASIGKTWSIKLVENFARHFWQNKFNQFGLPSRFSSAHLRHQLSGCLNWDGASDLVLSELIKQISVIQEKVLAEMGIHFVHGLAGKGSSYAKG